jgi:hypothetical protein
VENLQKWNTSIDKTLLDDKHTASMTTLKLPPSVGYDWRKDKEDPSCENIRPGIRIIHRSMVKLVVD